MLGVLGIAGSTITGSASAAPLLGGRRLLGSAGAGADQQLRESAVDGLTGRKRGRDLGVKHDYDRPTGGLARQPSP